MNVTEGILDCNNCELQRNQDQPVCVAVARRTVRELGSIGIDTSSDMRPPVAIVTGLMGNEAAQGIIELECQLRKLGQASLHRGYGTEQQ